MLYFHFCKRYIERVAPEVDRVVRNKLKDFEKRDGLQDPARHFGNGVYVLYTSSPTNMRTIIQKQSILLDNDTEIAVYFVQEIINSKDLQTLQEIKKNLWAKYNPIEESDIDSFIKEQQKNQPIEEEKEPLPSYLQDWVNEYKITINCEVYETSHWVEFATSNSIEDGMREGDKEGYYALLRNILQGDSLKEEVLNEYENVCTATANHNGYQIIYSKIKLNNINYFLLHCGSESKQKEHRSIMINRFKQDNASYQSLDDISKNAHRAYPSGIVTKQENGDLWKDVQKNSNTSNLSLLSEQIDFLRSFKFPAYIDGQAGSGKSTMLYYLFANAYYYKCADEIKGNMIFLTENEELLKSTKKAVRELLQLNTEFNDIPEESIENIDRHFSTFKKFLLNILEEDVDKSKFLEEKYLDFSKFKQEYKDTRSITNDFRNRYTPEFCWFVISTYIRGYDLEEGVNSNNYDEKLRRNSKGKISKEDLKAIESSVLPFYNKLLENNYWDKVKIIKYIKESIIINDYYEVLFCDEAQDFNRVEIEFILNLSEYLQYDRGDFNNTPIVFAGDELQTVNPTGFRKEEVKDLFYNELNTNLKENEYKPLYNYRSTQAIVNIANSVQCYRKNNFEVKIEYPQKAKQREEERDAYDNYFLSLDIIHENQEIFIQKLENKSIILPCNPDEKSDFIKKQPFLTTYTNYIREKAADNLQNSKEEILEEDIAKSAIEAKGIDYPQVVIYGFGAYCLETLGNYNDMDTYSYDTNYFFNKLYVAVTRAQEELIIIDTTEAYTNFWQPLLNDYANSDFRVESDTSKDEILKTIVVIESTENLPFEKGTPDMALENAKREKDRAKIDKNAKVMESAAKQFLTHGRKKDYNECKGEQAEMENDYLKAAVFYRKGNSGTNRSIEMYWKGQHFKEMQKISSSVKTVEQEIRNILTDIVQTGNSVSTSKAEYLKNHKNLLSTILRNTPWRTDLINSLINYSKQLTESEKQKDFIEIYEEITSNNTDIKKEIANLQYKVKRYQDAVNTWEGISETENPLYIHALSEIAKSRERFDEYIYQLGTLSEMTIGQERIDKANREIITTYESHKSTILQSMDTQTALYIASAYLQYKSDDSELLNILKQAEQKAEGKRQFVVNQYQSLLNTNSLPEILYNSVLERWAKNSFITGKKVDEINTEYEVFTKQSDYDLTPFTQEELDKISNLPEYIIPKLSDHIGTITINNFRKFKNLKIENLGLFNLIVGDNNIGKTSLLEAFLFTPDKKEYLKRLAFAHIDRKNLLAEKETYVNQPKDYYNISREFLNDFKNHGIEKFKIEFSFKQNRNFWKYAVATEEEPQGSGVLSIVFTEEDYRILEKLYLLDSLNSPFMPYGKGFSKELSEAYVNEINGKGRSVKREFAENLKIFIPNIDEVEADNKAGEIFIYEKDNENRIALSQYGEGANKIFRILLLLTIHKGKRLMIDEIDAGIHYTRFKDFWKVILQIAEKDKTQIIATTHNEECIEYFTEVLEELGEAYQNEARVVQCKNVANKLKVRAYDFENFNLAAELGIDIRGEAAR